MEGEIEVIAWLKNNKDWYHPVKKVDLSLYKNVELLSLGYERDLFYAWDDEKTEGRLFSGKWNKGIK